MNLFSVALERALQSKEFDRSTFSAATGIGLPTLSKYINGKAFPKPPALARIMSELPQEEAAEVFGAYLKEVFGIKTLEKVESGLSLQKEEGILREDSVKYSSSKPLPEEDEELEYTLLLLKELAKQKPEVGEMLKAILKSF